MGKQSVVGIDFGSCLMKVCYAEPSPGGRWRILRTSYIATPKDAIRDGVIVNRTATAAALRDLLKSANLSHVTGANAAVAGASVIVRHIKMPRLTEAVLRKTIRYEATKHITTSIEDCSIEFEILGPVEGEPENMHVMLVVAPNEMVNSRLETLTLAGLEPTAIDVEAFAVQRALLEIGGPCEATSNTSVALLDIGANSTDVTIVTNGYFALTRHISIAGDHFTSAIRNARNCSPDEAQELKFQADMSALLNPDSEPEAQELARLVQPSMDELLREVRRSVNYYQSQVAEGSLGLPIDPRRAENGGGRVSKLIVTGGSALLKGIDAYMGVRLGMPVEQWNVFEDSDIDSTQLAPSFLQAHHSLFTLSTGLALKRLGAASSAPKAGPPKSAEGSLASRLSAMRPGSKKAVAASATETAEADEADEQPQAA